MSELAPLGVVPVADSTRFGFMYRSGELSGVTPHGAVVSPWHYHHIRPAFRHRSCKVRCKNPPNCRSNRIARSSVYQRGLQPRAYGPVRISANPPGPTKPTQTVSLVDAFNSSGKAEAFMQLYSEILDAGGPAFGVIPRHVRDSPNDAFIFHCTADPTTAHDMLSSREETMQAFPKMPGERYDSVKEYVRRACSLDQMGDAASPAILGVEMGELVP